MYKSPHKMQDQSEKRPFSRKTESARAKSSRMPLSPGNVVVCPVSPLSEDGGQPSPDANHRHSPHHRYVTDESYSSGDGWCPQVYSCMQGDAKMGLSALNKQARGSVDVTSRLLQESGSVKSNPNWRKAAACQILSNSDEEEDDADDNSTIVSASMEAPFTNASGDDQRSFEAMSQGTRGSALQLQRNSGLDHSNHRVVAPNVAKLNPSSCVEVCLYSPEERVTVLCSADVLKMKSAFFCDVLVKQENHVGNKVGLWRSPLEINEAVPYEAVTLLESLHDCTKGSSKVEWSFSWARLSVRWQVEELLIEFAGQIDRHMDSLAARISASHWRTCPATLIGLRAAVFRKGSSAIPTVVTGVVIAPLATTGYSKLRIAFDSAMTEGAMAAINPPQVSFQSPLLALSSLASLRHRSLSATSTTGSIMGTTASQPIAESAQIGSPRGQTQQSSNSNSSSSNGKQIVADVSEPVWVRVDKEGCVWQEPDDTYATNRQVVTVTDRRLFWEMSRAVVSLPQLSHFCQGPVRTSATLCAFLLCKEHKVLWYPEVSLDFLPKDDALDLIKRAYCTPLFPENKAGVGSSNFDR